MTMAGLFMDLSLGLLIRRDVDIEKCSLAVNQPFCENILNQMSPIARLTHHEPCATEPIF
jgi:hypothetical protein